MSDTDFNGDGRDDILWRFAWPDYQVHTWQAGDGATFTDLSTTQTVTVPHEWNILGTGDFDGDGLDDILWVNDVNQIGNWLGGEDGRFVITDHLLSVPSSFSVKGIGDFDGDGKDELLVMGSGNASNAVDFIFAYHAADFEFSMGGYASVPADWSVAGVGDFNKDGRDDILWRNVDGTIGNWLANDQFDDFGGTGPGPSGFDINNASLAHVTLDWSVAGVGDFNGDGYDDILWRHDSGTIGVWRGGPDGLFTVDTDSIVHVPTEWRIAATGDYDGDFTEDILWRNPAQGLFGTWQGTATGDFEINPNLYSLEARWVVDPDISDARGFLGLT